MGIFLKEQHAVNGLLRHGEKIIIFMSFTAAATERREMFNLLCRETDFFFPPTVGPTSDTAQGWPQINRATARPSEPECSHTGMSAVTVMRKLDLALL